MSIDPSRLYTTLLNTGLQQKNNALYQVIHDLIGLVTSINKTTSSGSFSGGGGGASVINNTNITQISLDSGSSDDSLDQLSYFPIMSSSSSSIDAFIPYYVAPTDTYVIPINKQGLFSMNIDNEGIIEIDGFLIEVDDQGDVESSGSSIASVGIPGFDGIDGEDALIIPGPAGIAGSTGAQGIQGLIGSTGFPGFDGEDLGYNEIWFPPAIQQISNHLDYAQGTWTPVLTCVTPGNLTIVYFLQSGRYTKLANYVILSWIIVTSTFTWTTASGIISITGLPFPAKNIANYYQFQGGLQWQGITKVGYTHAYPVFSPGVSTFGINMSGSAQAVANIAISDLPTLGGVNLSGVAFYEV
jgi:hypothetical protein